LAEILKIFLSETTKSIELHPVNISGKFGWFLFSCFREEDLNVKS
jgi:hypothetical protein